MKKLFLLLTVFISVHVSFAQTSFSSAQRSKTATLYCYYDGMSGLASKNSSGQMSGMLVDAMNAFKKYLKDKYGIAASISYDKKSSFKAMMDAVRNGKSGAFGLSNISMTDARKSNYAFSVPYMQNVSVLLTNQRVTELSSLKNVSTAFKGKKAYTTAGTTNSQRLLNLKKTEMPALDVVMLPSTDDAMRKVMNDNNAFTMVDLVYYLGNSTYRKNLKRHPAGDSNRGDQFAIAMPKSSDWVTAFNDFFKPYSRSTAHKTSVGTHLGSSSLRMINTY